MTAVPGMTPHAVWDVHDPAWWPGHEAKSQWLRDHRVPVDHTYRVEFYLIDMPFARVFSYHVNEDGRHHWDHGHNPQGCGPGHLCGVCRHPPSDVPLSELPPGVLCGAG